MMESLLSQQTPLGPTSIPIKWLLKYKYFFSFKNTLYTIHSIQYNTIYYYSFFFQYILIIIIINYCFIEAVKNVVFEDFRSKK